MPGSSRSSQSSTGFSMSQSCMKVSRDSFMLKGEPVLHRTGSARSGRARCPSERLVKICCQITKLWRHLNACEGDFGGFPRRIPLKSIPSCSRRDLLHDLYGPSNLSILFRAPRLSRLYVRSIVMSGIGQVQQSSASAASAQVVDDQSFQCKRVLTDNQRTRAITLSPLSSTCFATWELTKARYGHFATRGSTTGKLSLVWLRARVS